jgi:hypothetical protein
MLKADGGYWQLFDDRLFLFCAQQGEDRWSQGDYTKSRKLADRPWHDIVVGEGD